ncbi:MAG: hypothetical protein Q9160_009361 [Pyrenula sp. 1 TL-2023]
MAEIGLVASIIGVAGAGAKVSLTLFQIANALGSAADEVRFIAADTNALSLVLTNLSNVLRVRRAIAASEGEEIAGATLLLCRSILESTDELVSCLSPLLERSCFTATQAALRLRWLFEKSKFMAHRQSLESLKSTLNLLVSTISFAAAAKVSASDLTTESFRTQAESLKTEIQGRPRMESASLLLQASQAGKAAGRLLLQAPALSSDQGEDPPLMDRNTGNAENAGPTSLAPNEGQAHTTGIEDRPTTSNDLALVPRPSDSGENDMDREYGRFSIDALESCLEISLLQRRTVRYADSVLQSPPDPEHEGDDSRAQVLPDHDHNGPITPSQSLSEEASQTQRKLEQLENMLLEMRSESMRCLTPQSYPIHSLEGSSGANFGGATPVEDEIFR